MQHGYSALHAAASYGNAGVLSWLLSNGGDASLVDADGDTPLHVCEDAACGQLLVAAGADAFASNAEGKVPYEVAASEGRAEYAVYLQSVYAARGRTVPEVELSEDAYDFAEDEEGDDSEAGVVGVGAGGGVTSKVIPETAGDAGAAAVIAASPPVSDPPVAGAGDASGAAAALP